MKHLIKNMIRVIRNAPVLPQAQDMADHLDEVKQVMNSMRFPKSGANALKSAVLEIGALDCEKSEAVIHMRPGFSEPNVEDPNYYLAYGPVVPLHVFLTALKGHGDVLKQNGLIVDLKKNEKGDYESVLTFSPNAEPDTLGAVLRERAEARPAIDLPDLG